MNQVQGGGSKVMSFGKSRAKRHVGRLAEDHLPRRRGRRRGGRGAARDQGVPREPEEVPGARRAHPQGRAALRASGHRQDAARARRRRRGGRAVLLDLRLGLRRDVRRRRRLARARPLRAGQAELALHHLHGRDRRRRAPPRRRPRRRSRRARADAQPAARRDGRLRDEGQHHPDRGHQPARHPRSRRCCAPAASTARSPSTAPTARAARRSSRSTRAASRWPRRSTSTRSPARRPGFTGADLSNLVNEAALLAARTGKREITQVELEEGIMRVIAGPEKKTRVMGEKERLITAYHEMGHAIVGHYLEHSDPVHKISIISRGQALGYTISMPQEDKFLTTRAELHRHDGDDARRPRRRGDRLRRDHHRRVERPREGHGDGQADGHALRHEREARPARVRPRPRPAVPRPRVLLRARLLRRDRARDRRRDPPHRRGRAPARQGHPHRAPRARSSTISEILLKRETIEKEEFEALLAGKTEEEVFGPEAPPPGPPIPGEPAPERAGREAPRPLPRPGLAGGGVEARGLDLPEKPELA